MGEALKKSQNNLWWRWFFQIPLWLLGTFGLYELAAIFCYSFTDYNMVESPSFIGLENYFNIFEDDMVRNGLSNTIIMVCIVAVLLILTAIIPAIFVSKLKLRYGLVIMGMFFLISICTMMPVFSRALFSGDICGIFNSWFLSNSIIKEPITFTTEYAMPIAIVLTWLYCLGPVFSITYIAARMKHSFLGTAIAVCVIPILMYCGGGIVTDVVGYPSVNHSADWIYTIFNDYLTTRYEVGYAYAILVIGLIMLMVWCTVISFGTFGFWALCKKINSNSTVFKVFGYITFSLSVVLFLGVLNFVIIYFAKAFMPLDELLVFQNNSYWPKRPTLDNFTVISALLSNLAVPISQYLYNSLLYIPLLIMSVCFFVAFPSGVGLGVFDLNKRQRLLLLCFIPLLFVSGYMVLAKLGLFDTYGVYMVEFISSFEFLIAVFLVYLASRLVLYGTKLRVGNIVMGCAFILTSFYALGVIRGIWYSGNSAIYTETLGTWKDLSITISAGGIARMGSTAANDLLMLLATIGVIIIPLILLFFLYRSYRKTVKL